MAQFYTKYVIVQHENSELWSKAFFDDFTPINSEQDQVAAFKRIFYTRMVAITPINISETPIHRGVAQNIQIVTDDERYASEN